MRYSIDRHCSIAQFGRLRLPSAVVVFPKRTHLVRVLEEDLKLHALGVSALALGAQLIDGFDSPQEARPVATDEEQSSRQHDETAADWPS
jgi:hypothetical protein